MGNKIVNVFVLVLVGTIIADLVASGRQTVGVLDAFGRIWGNSLNAVGGNKTS